jgi:bifunctional non-homologous end joining protein LigD
VSESQTIRIGRRKLDVSNLDKVMYPAAGFTKGEVIEYYARVGEVLLPHLAKRPMTLKRYPSGVEGKFFYEKSCPSHKPEWVHTTDVQTQRRAIQFCVVDDLSTLVWLANIASLELHPLLARAPRLDRPTMLVFDLDPGEPAALLDCLPVAIKIRVLFEGLDLHCFAKTSGGKGLHLAVPLNTAVTFEDTKAFARTVAQALEQDDPKRVTSNMRKSDRQGKVFVDWSQNDTHKSTVSVYSLRARSRPTVSTPVTWEEIEEAIEAGDASKLIFETNQVLERVDACGDLWREVNTMKQKLPSLSLTG